MGVALLYKLSVLHIGLDEIHVLGIVAAGFFLRRLQGAVICVDRGLVLRLEGFLVYNALRIGLQRVYIVALRFLTGVEQLAPVVDLLCVRQVHAGDQIIYALAVNIDLAFVDIVLVIDLAAQAQLQVIDAVHIVRIIRLQAGCLAFKLRDHVALVLGQGVQLLLCVGQAAQKLPALLLKGGPGRGHCFSLGHAQ